MAAKKVSPISEDEGSLTISPPKFFVLNQRIVGTSPYVQLRFSEKARGTMEAKHREGSTAQKGAKKQPRDFDADYEGAFHRGPKGEHGIPAAAFRAAAISACRLVGFKMTLAKLGLFIEADFIDERDGTPLVAIEGKASKLTLPVRNASGVADLRVRAKWNEWSARLRVRFDSDMFKLEDVVNLLTRIGAQVGIGEGRADSRKSAGMGWGAFVLDGAGSVETVVFTN